MNAPARIGPYEIIAEIGRGGMSVVYHGRDTRNQTEVALKVLAPIIVGRSGEAADRRAPQPDPAATGAQATPYVDQFLKEARTAGRLRHRNVVRVLEVGESQGYHYLALEYADRGTLAELLESDPRPMNPDEVVSIILQVAEALDYAHKLGYLHCDVKASNVLLTSDGRALVSDFGIARRLASGADSSPEDDPGAADDNQPIATPAYASPEQACGERNLDRRTDVYSLGVVAYYMLTGRLPFGSTDKNELLRQVVDDPPPPPESLNPRIPVAMAYALTRALAKDPRARYATTVELAQALRAGLGKAGHQAAYAPATVRPPRPRRPGLATPRLIAVMAGALAFLALGLAAVALAGPALPALSVSLPVLRPIVTANPVPTQRPAKPTFTPMPTPPVSAAAPAAVPTAARLFASATQTSNLVVQMPRVPVMQEDFSIARPWWPEVKDKNSWWRVADGVYRLTIHPANTKVWLWRGVDIANFTLSFDAASMWQLPDVHVGLIFRANGTNDFHQLDCQPGKGCELSREHNTAKTVLLPRTVIPQGKLNEPARISVTANDQDIQISINDQTLASVKDPDYHRGDIALYGVSGADNEAEFSFDNYDFQPGANETTSVTLMPYQDPDGRYILNVPADWQKSTDEHAVN
ncbi:MAG TPA: serine/threonine-protein kinase, partial [Anaerolineae bacterium]